MTMISLRSKITQKIFDYFLVNPELKRYVNELAGVLGVDPKNLYVKLKELEEKEGFLKSEFQGRERYFYLNKKYPYLKEYRTIFLKTIGIEKTLKETLSHIKGIETAYIFGSYVKNKMDVSSDIDLLIVGNHPMIELQREINKLQKRIGREINIINVSREEFNKKKKKSENFFAKVLERPYIKVI